MKRSALARKETFKLIDPVMADPKHYSIEFENDNVRVVRIKYGPHETSVMHDHPSGVVVFITDLKSEFIFLDGTKEIVTAKAGESRWMDAFSHLSTNLSDKEMELLYIELKQW